MSYSHAADGALAPALQSGLHRFAKPWNRLRAVHVFRDKSSLAVSPGLWSAIEEALAAAGHFILLASPAAAASEWVIREVEWWLANRSPKKLLIAVTDGDVAWDGMRRRFDPARSSALPAALHDAYDEEPQWLDLRWARQGERLSLRNPRFAESVAELAAPLHDRTKEEMFGEDRRQHRRTRRYAWLAGIVVVLAVAAAGGAFWYAAEQRDATVRQRIDAVYVDGGTRAVDGHDWSAALLWYVAALRADAGNKDHEDLHRVRIGAILRQHPRLESVHLHGDALIAVQFDRRGGALMSASRDGAIIVARSGVSAVVHDARINGATIKRAVMSPDAATVVTVSERRDTERGESAVRWDASTGEVLGWYVDGTRYDTWSASDVAAPGPIVSVRHEGVETWVDGRRTAFYARSEFSTARVTTSAAGELVLAAGLTSAEVWRTGQDASLFEGLASGPAAFAPDNRWLAIADASGETKLLDTSADQRATREATAADRFFGRETRTPRRIAQDPPVVAVAFHPREPLLLTANAAGSVQVWRVPGGEPALPPLRHGDGVNGARFSRDGALIVTFGRDDLVRFWSTAAARPLGAPLRHGSWYPRDQWSGRGQGVRVADFGGDGRLVTGGADGTVRVWNLLLEQPRTLGPEASGPSTTGSASAGALIDSSVGQYRHAPPPNEPLRIAALPHLADLVAVASSGSGEHAVTTDRLGNAVVWDLRSRKPLTKPVAVGAPVIAVDLSADGRRLATATASGGRVWDASSGRPVSDSLPHAQLMGVQLSRDGALAVTHGASGIGLWEASTGKRIADEIALSGTRSVVRLSADARWLLIAQRSGNERWRARVWDARAGRPVTPELPLARDAGDVAFVAGGAAPSFVERGPGNVAHLWDLTPDQRSPEQLELLARVLSNRRIDDAGVVIPLSRSEFVLAWRELCGADRSVKDAFACVSEAAVPGAGAGAASGEPKPGRR